MSESFSARRITGQEPVVLNTDPAGPPPLRCPECQLSAGETTMRRLIIAALAAASLLTAAVSAADAGWIATATGWVYVPYCYYDVFGYYWCY